MFHYAIKPTRQKLNKKPIYGFDIETCDNNQDFVLASIYSEEGILFFYDKISLINEFKKKRYENSYIVASNLGFDFFGLIFGSEEQKKFYTLFRGSNLIMGSAYLKDGKLLNEAEADKHRAKKITFIDTWNYSPLSVDDLGKIIKFKKLAKPSFLGKRRPRDAKEWEILKAYNARDSEISCKALKFFFSTFEALGATAKITIAGTAMSLFKNRYLKDTYYRHDPQILEEEFKAYYGGRVEAIGRGAIKDCYLYDFNSLYPDVMRKSYPDPNSLHITYKNTLRYINNYEGISKVRINAPKMKYPFLPVRTESKLIFPYGTLEGYYTHVELRKALELGYTIIEVYKTFYYKKTCEPFKAFVDDLYSMRKRYKAENNPMEYVCKILMNSLYGKFGQKFLNRDNWIPFPETIEEIKKYDYLERHGDYARIKKEFSEPKAYCIPVWCSYVTAYGRIKLYDAIIRYNAEYFDTDSIITKEYIESKPDIGAFKLVCRIDYGVIVKPKFYGFISGKEGIVRIKGLPKMKYEDFEKFLIKPERLFKKFIKFKEAMRRNIPINSIIDVSKELTLEDNKRVWLNIFDFRKHEMSDPIKLSCEHDASNDVEQPQNNNNDAEDGSNAYKDKHAEKHPIKAAEQHDSRD